MKQEEIDHLLALVKAPLDHPLFYPRVYALVARHFKAHQDTQDSLIQIVSEEYVELSRRLDRSEVQESCSVRNVLRSRQLAIALIDEKGEVRLDLLPQVVAYLQTHLYSLGPQRHYDGKRQEHILKVLRLLHENKDVARLIKKFTRPFSNQWAEELIRQTLELPPKTVVTDVHTRQAVLAAWLCTLRQNVGSCFATAPAEIVHDEQHELFLQDMLDLIATGRLKRTFGGAEYTVPLSGSWGSGDLKKPLLIKLTSKGIAPEIWHSPGLITAFEAVGFLQSTDKLKDKIKQIEGWLIPYLYHGSAYYKIVTVEELIRKVVLQLLGLTERQLKEFESRPRGMIQTRFMMDVSQMTKNTGGLGQRCAHFFQLFEAGKNAFKALADNALLKAWEYTLASFADTKNEFTRWNLYASLGLGANEPGGIGRCIYETIQHKLDVANRKVQDLQLEYEAAYTHVKGFEARMRHPSSEKEAQWLKAEYQTHANEFYFLEEQRNAAQHEANALVNLYDSLYKLYVEYFTEYFQEIYDADMQEVAKGPFDDSPAGFRLLYKHGRSNPSQWTLIKTPQDFVDSLAAFFVATEPQIAHSLESKKIEKDLSDVVTAIVNHVKTDEFIESSFHRMAVAHQAPLVKDPLEHLDKIEKKPWAYTSGGTMNSLISSYYKLEDKPAEVAKWVENEIELLVFIADSLKRMPPALLAPFIKGQRHAMLMQSPTHAFLLKPTWHPFKDTWNNEEYTYTFIRDRYVRPAQIFVGHLLLNDVMIDSLVQTLNENIPENYQPRFKELCRQISGPLTPPFFRDHLASLLAHDRGLSHLGRSVLNTDEIDTTLYSCLPYFDRTELQDRVHKIFSQLPGIDAAELDQAAQLIRQIPFSSTAVALISAQQLQDICKAILCLIKASVTVSLDYSLHISAAAQKLGFAMPAPVIFADSNWVKDMFGFVVNPGTGRLELWRIDYTGSHGSPMSNWKQWLNGSRQDLKWDIYVKPFQYGQS